MNHSPSSAMLDVGRLVLFFTLSPLIKRIKASKGVLTGFFERPNSQSSVFTGFFLMQNPGVCLHVTAAASFVPDSSPVLLIMILIVRRSRLGKTSASRKIAESRCDRKATV